MIPARLLCLVLGHRDRLIYRPGPLHSAPIWGAVCSRCYRPVV